MLKTDVLHYYITSLYYIIIFAKVIHIDSNNECLCINNKLKLWNKFWNFNLFNNFKIYIKYI